MKTVFFSSFCDTVAATHDKNRFQSDFCCRSSLSLRPDLVVLHMCELIHLIVWEAKNGSCRMLSCRVVSPMCELAYSRHDTTRQYATRPVFSLPIQSNGSVHTYAARQCLVVTTKSCGTKNRSGSDFCRVTQRQYQENC